MLTALLLAAAGLAADPPRAVPAAAPAAHRAAADTLAGVVTDGAGAPLAGVEATVVELERRTRSDADGRFTFAGLPPGRYLLQLRLPGHAPAVVAFGSGSAGPVRVALRPSPVELESLVVTAARTPLAAAASPLSVATLGPGRLRASSSVSLAHALEGVPGVATLSTGQQVGKPVIRGFSGSRVLVLADGLRLEDYSWSDEDAPSIDARLAQRVEVVRGPASLLYGSDAEGGVVNVVPEPLPDAVGRRGFVRTGAESWFATNNRESGLVLRGEGARGAAGWRATVIGRLGQDYHTPAGEVENTGFGALNGELAGGFRGDWGSVVVRYDRYGGEFKLLEADSGRAGVGAADPAEEEGPERKLSDDRVQAAAVLPWRGIRLEPRAQWQRHSLVEVADELNGERVPGKESVQFDLLLDTYSLDLLAHHGGGGGTEGTVGVSALLQHNDTRGPVPLVPDARVRSAALFAVEQVELGPVRLLAGARADGRGVEWDPNAGLGLAAGSRTWRAATFNLAGTLELGGGLAARAGVGRGWRAPNLFELFANGPRLGEARFDVGSAELDTESTLALDGGLRWRGRGVEAEVEGFHHRVDDYLYAAPTAELRQGLRVFRYAQTRARLWGGEAAVQVEPSRGLMLRGAVDVTRGTDAATGRPLPLMPPPRALLRAELRPGEGASARGTHLWTQLRGVARQSRPAAGEYAPGGYALLDLGGGWEPRLVGRRVRLEAQLENALDTAYRSFLSRYKEFALDPGRSLTVRAAWGL